MKSIFVQVASYRDPELLPTIRDCINKSSGENRLTFGLVWQKDDSESIDEFANDSRFRIIDVPWNKSKGLGWARQLTQSMYNDEDYTLQIDSHHRFKNDWDKILVEMIENLKKESSKPILTSYAAAYQPGNNDYLGGAPCKILPRDFKSSGTIWFNPVVIPNYHLLNKPIRARFISGHFFFVDGFHCKEYKYDPDLYFAGDEIALSARCFTMGYDLYHPHINVIYHFYGRNDQSKHWTDHNEKNRPIIEKTWSERDAYSKKRIRQLLGEENNNIDLGVFGLGNQRSIEEYEKYAGIDFKKKRILKKAIEGTDPPITFDSEEDWNNGFKKETVINLKEWPRQTYLDNAKILNYIDINLYNLQKNIIFNKKMTLREIEENKELNLNITCDYSPMRISIQPYFNNQNINNNMSWTRDLKPNIHWS